MFWGDGSGVPTSAKNLVIVGADNNGLLHIRIFDAGGNRVTDTDETKLPSTQAGAITTLKQQLPGLLPPHKLTSAEMAQVIAEATLIVGQTLRGYHIAHLLLHVTSEQGRNFLVFADPEGTAEPVPGEEVARSIVGKGSRQPYLVFLATPLEALAYFGEADRTPVALAPMFIEAGAQAAVAMQAAVGIKNLQRFTQCFYAVLARTGVVDLAMALARAEIYEEGDWEWTYPVLCMRTPDAQLFQPLPMGLERQVRGIFISS